MNNLEMFESRSTIGSMNTVRLTSDDLIDSNHEESYIASKKRAKFLHIIGGAIVICCVVIILCVIII